MGSPDGEHSSRTTHAPFHIALSHTWTAWLEKPDDVKPLRGPLRSSELSWPDVCVSSGDRCCMKEKPWTVRVDDAPAGAALLPFRTPDQRLQVPGHVVQHHLPEVEDQCLEQVQTMVEEEVLKDINTACKLLNIPADPSSWSSVHVQKWLLWTEHLHRLPHSAAMFQQVSGRELCAMTEADFRRCCCSPFGDVLYAHLDIWRSAAAMKTLYEREDYKSGFCFPTSPVDESCWSSYPNQPIHLWQFLRELLLKPHSYSRCIRWLNKDTGIFKIEDSALVARLWGIRKNRPAMNYDKLSRSIRQYYKKGIIRKPELSGRLIYQFVIPV